MKVKIFTLALLITGLLGFSQQTYVPDDNFEQALIDLGYDTDLDDYVTTSHISSKIRLNLIEKNISDLTGLEDFTALISLKCPGNQITSLDVSQNTALQYLWCDRNQLTSLDVTQNTALVQLWCAENQITGLDVTQNTALESLRCDRNQLASLNVAQNIAIEELYCHTNQISSLNLSQNMALATLISSKNPLNTLDVTQNTALESLTCNENQLTSLDISQNMALTLLSFRQNQLTTIDVSQHTALTLLICSSNQLTNLDVSPNPELELLYCSYNQLSSLNVKNGNNTNITDFNFRANNNPDLTCITVDDVAYSSANWFDIDAQTSFSEQECSTLNVSSVIAPTIQLYPNPTSSLVTIDTPIDIEKVEIYNLLGKLVLQKQASNTINISELSKGMYIIKINSEKGTISKKLVKK